MDAEKIKKRQEKEEARLLRKQERKTRRALRIARCRGLKNFGWWLFGFLTPTLVIGVAGAICVCVLPTNIFVGKDGKYVDEETSKKTLLQILMNYQSYTVGNFPIIKEALKTTLSSSGLDKYLEINYDELEKTSLSTTDYKSIFDNCVEITATIDNLGVASSLGAFGNLSVMKENTEVTEAIDPTAEDFEPYMYYYIDDNGKLKRAYKDDKTLVEAAAGKQLYYPALVKVPLDQIAKVIPTRIGQAEMLEVLGIFTNVESGSMLAKVFNGYTVKDMGSFDANNILLSDVLTYSEDNKAIFDILCAAAVVGEGEEKPTHETVTIGHLNHIDINNVPLSTVIKPSTDNEKIYAILMDATGKEKAEDVTIGDISKADLDGVKLSSLLKEEDNPKLAKILTSAVGAEKYDDVKLGSLKDFDTANIYIKDAVDLSDDLKDILLKGCGVENYDDLTLGSLATFEMSNVPLSCVIKESEDNKKLIAILKDATGKEDYSSIVVDDLSNGFNIDNVKLSTVIEETEDNKSLFNILSEATGVEKKDLKLSNLSSFNISNVKLSTVISEETGNKALDTLLKDDSVTIANMGDKINNLSLYSIYGEDCFTTDVSQATITTDHYVRTETPNGYMYTYDSDGDYDGDYYISKSSGVMLLMSFDVTNVDFTCGRANTLIPSSLTFENMDKADSTSSALQNATIYQMIAAGLIEDKADGGYSNDLKRMTIQDLLNALDSIPSVPTTSTTSTSIPYSIPSDLPF